MRLLPGAGARAGALAGRGARTRDVRAGLGDREVVTRLRVTHDRVTGSGVARDGRLAGTGTERNARLGHVLRGLAVGVGLRPRVARLHVRDEVTGVRLRRSVLALLTLTQESGQRDRGQNADDEDHNEELDKGETLVLTVNALAELTQHVSPPFEV